MGNPNYVGMYVPWSTSVPRHIFLLVGEAILQFLQSYPAHDGHLDKCNNMVDRLPNELWASVIAQVNNTPLTKGLLKLTTRRL